MKIDDLVELELDELQSILKDVTAAIEIIREKKEKAAYKAMEDVAKEYGISMDAVIKKHSKTAPTRRPPKYRNPDNYRQTWHGAGRHPEWIKDKIEEGIALEKLLIME